MNKWTKSVREPSWLLQYRRVRLSSHTKDQMVHKVEIYTIWLFPDKKTKGTARIPTPSWPQHLTASLLSGESTQTASTQTQGKAVFDSPSAESILSGKERASLVLLNSLLFEVQSEHFLAQRNLQRHRSWPTQGTLSWEGEGRYGRREFK